MQQTFSMEPEPRVSLTRAGGDLKVTGWSRPEISLDWDERAGNVHQEGNVLILLDCPGDIELSVPSDTEICVEDLGGEVCVQDVRRIELRNVRGDVELKNIGADVQLEYAGEAVSLTDIGGDLHVQRASSVRAYRKIGGDADIQDVSRIELETAGADLKVSRAETLIVGSVGADLEADELSGSLRCGNVGGDCKISGSSQAEVNLGNVSGDLEIAGALLVHLGNAGGDTTIRDVQRSVSVGNIGGDGELTGVGGDVKAGRIGADAVLHGLGGSVSVGGVGGDLDLQAAFAPASRTQIHIGGDARVALPADASLTLQASVGGSIGGVSFSSGSSSSLVRLVYGEGAAYVNLSVGGDLQLSGGGSPQVSSAGVPWREFGQEMARMGQELGDEFRKTFRDLGWSGIAWTDEVGRRVEEQVRRAREKAEHNARKAEKRAQRAGERARQRAERGRVRMQFNEREWQMSPARLDDLVDRARQAAMEGVAGAMEAVERAVNNLRVPYPPYSPPPGSRPVPPTPPAPPRPPAAPSGDLRPQTDSFPTPVMQPTLEDESAEASHIEQEREAILRMIAEGRITPEEGDMLLEGLGS